VDKDKIFNEIVNNAFDFLEASIEQFDKSAKFSVIAFQSAIELFLKSRLFKEHWALVLIEPNLANKDKFIQGDFKSVGVEEANARLKSICKDGLGAVEIDCFIKLTRHRNQMVHFFHASQHAEDAKEAVVSELCRAWYYLHRLLTVQWGSHFGNFANELSAVDDKMHKHRDFLKKKFQLVEGQIEDKKSKGHGIQRCPSCRFKAMFVSQDHPTFERECLVCKLEDWGVKVECPDCETTQWLVGDCWSPCETKKCDHSFDAEEVADLIKYDTSNPGDVDDPSEAACADCDSLDCVVKLENGKWLCVNCFVLHDDSDIGQCGWCNGYCVNLSEDSFMLGCAACEGHGGWTRDD